MPLNTWTNALVHKTIVSWDYSERKIYGLKYEVFLCQPIVDVVIMVSSKKDEVISLNVNDDDYLARKFNQMEIIN